MYQEFNMKTIIIGTAGRSHQDRLTPHLWQAMVAKALELTPKGSHGVSGGAAWADHLAVELYRLGHLSGLTLHLPAPLDPNNYDYIGPPKSAASAANYYHYLFSDALGYDTKKQIAQALVTIGATHTAQPPAPGFKAMFTRNAIVAKEATEPGLSIAFTWDHGALTDSGTKNTFDQIKLGTKTHVSLYSLG